MRTLLVLALVSTTLGFTEVALAQAAPASTTPAPAPATGDTPAPSAQPAAPKGDMGGYSYADKPARSSGAGGGAAAGKKGRIAHKKGSPEVDMPGFEQTPDGGSRLFVKLSTQVPVEERKGAGGPGGTITYVLKGASARVWNNTNALVTVFQNTPVSRARLVPHGKDLNFVLDLRAASTPTWKFVDAPDKTSMLQIDFPAGVFAPVDKGDVGDNATTPAEPGAAGNAGNGDAAEGASPSPARPAPPATTPKKPGKSGKKHVKKPAANP